MANRRSRKKGIVYAYSYKFDYNTDLAKSLNVKRFSIADVEWLKFVMSNRFGIARHKYDIVIGHTADADTVALLEQYRTLFINGKLNERTMELIIDDLKPEHLSRQFCFCSYESLRCLKRIERRVVG